MSLPERRHPLRPLFGKKTKAPKRQTVKAEPKAEDKPAKKTTAKKTTKKASK